MKSCTLCERAGHFNEGLIGKNYSETGVMFVLHISDSRALREGYVKAYKKTNTAQTVDKMLKNANLTLDDIVLTNFYKCIIPGDTNSSKNKDKIPWKKEYKNCVGVLDAQIQEIAPKKIVLFGSPVYNNLFGDSKEKFEEAVGRVKFFRNIGAFISYHPSGLRFKWNAEKKRVQDNLTEYLLN